MQSCAIVYDFDGTLGRGNIQEHTFLPDQGISKEKFWKRVKDEAMRLNADEILIYMQEMLKVAREAKHPVTEVGLREHGSKTPLFPGVETWFTRINNYARSIDLEIEHYLVSSGIREMIMGCSIASEFNYIFASSFAYGPTGEAEWPVIAINYTTKTQYLFRINKGVLNNWDNDTVNRWVPMSKRPMPFERMIFVGDGDTDIPCMKMVRLQKGRSIAVFDEERLSPQGGGREKLSKLISENRVDFVAPADYTEGSQLDITIKGILSGICGA